MMETTVAEYPISFHDAMIKSLLKGIKTQTRRPVHWRNSTVLGNPAKPYWEHLRFDAAQPRRDSSMMMFLTGEHVDGRDVHLSVPYANGWDADADVKDMGWYRVRPLWNVGDRLWVQERYSIVWGERDETGRDPDGVYYRADKSARYFNHFTHELEDDHGYFDQALVDCCGNGWQRTKDIPRWASRLTLEVTGLRVERLQEISESDAIAEGIHTNNFTGWGDEPGIPAFPEPDVYQNYLDQTKWGCGWLESPQLSYASLWKMIHGPESWDLNPWVWITEFKMR